MFNRPRLLVLSPKALSEVLTTKSYEFVKPPEVVSILSRTIGVGLILAEGDDHKFQRKHLAPAFSFRHIKGLYPTFWSKSVEVVQAIGAAINRAAGKPPSDTAVIAGISRDVKVASDQAIISVGEWSNRVALDIIGVAGMGQDFYSIANPDGVLHQAYVKIFRPPREAKIKLILTLLLPSIIINNLPFKRNAELADATNVIRDTCKNLIKTKRQRLADGDAADMDILSIAIESGAFTDEQLVDQMMTFLAAGHETTATSMIWAIYLLCVHPEVQTRLRAEIRAGLPSPDSGSSITSADIDGLPYVSAFCSEVLRHHSPVPLTVREAAVDTSIQGVTVPKGTPVYMAPWATNLDPELWGADADEFKPERWLGDKSGGAKTNYALMTFIHGPRSCIGEKFARGEFACLVATWVGRFEFELADPTLVDESRIEIRSGATSKPAKGLWTKTRRLPGW